MKDISNLNKRLTKLDLSNCNLTEVPQDVFKFKRLKVLKVSGNKIKYIPKEITSLNYLERLDLSNNKISVLHASIGKLDNLTTLNLNNNKIKVLPKQLDLSRIKSLSIANNLFKDGSIDFEPLIEVKKLNISGNLFTAFPYTRGNTFQKLEYLWMNNLDLRNLDNLKEFIDRNIAPLKGIYLYNNDLNYRNSSYHTYKILTTLGNSLTTIKKLDINSFKDTFFTPANKVNQLDKAVENKTENEKKDKMKKTKIFISYSHNDSEWLDKLKIHLKVLNLQTDSIDVWDDTKIKSGDKWKVEIEKALNIANIAILLISTDFLASDFITNNELPPILKAAKERGTTILPLIIRHCRFLKNKDIAQFQASNNPNKPLSKCNEAEIDEWLVKLTDDIEEAINDKIE